MPVDLSQLQQLPLKPSIPFQKFSTTIDGTTYVFNLRWNTTDAAWYFDLLDQDENPIVSGVKIVLGVALGRRSSDARMPRGAFMASDLMNTGKDAGLDDLGTRVAVYYYPFEQWFAD
jgi:hypothetical protein